LRPSLRDPLVTKINEVCGQEEDKTKAEPYINVNEMELNIATSKHRAASLDVRRPRDQNSAVNKPGELPSIGGNKGASLPGVGDASLNIG
jgi:hypothetical protein